jgi:hypothetical protein
MRLDAETFAYELELIATSPEAAQRFVARLAGYEVAFSTKALSPYRVAAARRLLRHGLSRAEVRDRLRERYGVSRSTAYRILRAALSTRGA